MRNALTLLLILAAAGGGWYLGKQYVDSEPQSRSPAGQSQPTDTPFQAAIRGIGKLEPSSGVLKIMAPMGQRIDSLYDLQIGSTVAVGQPIVRLAGREKAEQELQLAKAKKADAKKKESLEKTQLRLQRQAAQLALQEATAQRDELASKSRSIGLLRRQLEQANDTLQRLQRLKSSPATDRLVGQGDLDKQQLLVDQLETKLAQSTDELQSAEDKIKRAELAAQLDIERLNSILAETSIPMHSIDAAIQTAEKALDMLEIKSPIAGQVLDIVVRPGDTVTNQPVMLIGDTRQMVCIAEINDSSLSDVETRSAATMTSSALAKPLTGEVLSKGLMIGPPSMKDPNPFASVDRKTGRVVIKLDDSEIARDFVYLQVEVAIEPAADSD